MMNRIEGINRQTSNRANPRLQKRQNTIKRYATIKYINLAVDFLRLHFFILGSTDTRYMSPSAGRLQTIIALRTHKQTNDNITYLSFLYKIVIVAT